MPWVFTNEQRFYLHDGENLLDGMVRTGHKDVRFMCRQGFCGACKMTVKASTGRVFHVRPPLAHLADNEVLACCCQSTGTLVVSYDNVPQNPTHQTTQITEAVLMVCAKNRQTS